MGECDRLICPLAKLVVVMGGVVVTGVSVAVGADVAVEVGSGVTTDLVASVKRECGRKRKWRQAVS